MGKWRNPELSEFGKPGKLVPDFIAKNLADLIEIKQSLSGGAEDTSLVELLSRYAKRSEKLSSDELQKLEQMMAQVREAEAKDPSAQEIDLLLGVLAVLPPPAVQYMKAGLLDQPPPPRMSDEELRTRLIRVIDAGHVVDFRQELVAMAERNAANGHLTARELAREQAFYKTASAEQIADEILQDNSKDDGHESLRYMVETLGALADHEDKEREHNKAFEEIMKVFMTPPVAADSSIFLPDAPEETEEDLIEELNQVEFLEQESWDKSPIAAVFRPKGNLSGNELRRMVTKTRAKLQAVQGGKELDRFGLRDLSRSELLHRKNLLETEVRSMEQRRSDFSSGLERIGDDFVKTKRWTNVLKVASQAIPPQFAPTYELWLKRRMVFEVDFLLRKPTDRLVKGLDKMKRMAESIKEQVGPEVEIRAQMEKDKEKQKRDNPGQAKFIDQRYRQLMDQLLDEEDDSE